MYLPDEGEDTNAGRLVSIDSSILIHYHVGSLPREYANTKASGDGFRSARLGKSSFRYLHRNNILFVTFRNEGPANYWVKVKSQEDVDFIIELLARYRKEVLRRKGIGVTVQLDANGMVSDARGENGNAFLKNRAIQAAKSANFRRACDEHGAPIPSTAKVFVVLDENGKFIRFESPIVVGERIGGQAIVKRVNPEYPNTLRRAGIAGIVVLSVTIDKEGNVTKAELGQGHPSLAEYAIKAAHQWKFAPYYFDCVPIPITSTVTLTFR